jgi:hypothetical protein
MPIPPKTAFGSRNQVYVIHIYDEELDRRVGTSDKIKADVENDTTEECHTLMLSSEGVVNVRYGGRLFYVECEVINQTYIRGVNKNNKTV